MMIFQSRRGPDIMMFDEVARRVLICIGKGDHQQLEHGKLEVEELAYALKRLRHDSANSYQQMEKDRATAEQEEEGWAGLGPARQEPVYFFQRAQPLIELFSNALADEQGVSWKKI